MIMNDEEARSYLQERIDYVEKLIDECTQLKKEWEERIKEAEEARDNFKLLMKQFVFENNTDN